MPTSTPTPKAKSKSKAKSSGETLIRPESQFVDVDGKPVHWVDFGGPAGAPLAVCVHGLGGSWVNWMALAPLLTDRYRVVAFDFVGNGRTPVSGRRADVRSNRRLLAGFLRAVADGPVMLIGNSMGGLLSILQTARHPESVDRLVLIDAALPLPRGRMPRDPKFIGRFLLMAAPFAGERLLARRGRRKGASALVAETLDLVCVDRGRVNPELVREAEALAAERAGKPELDHAFLSAARSLTGVLARPQRYLDAMKQITAPTLLLFGAQDKLVPLASGQAVAARRPDWRFVVNPDLGHVPQIEDPDWTAKQILDWVSETG